MVWSARRVRTAAAAAWWRGFTSQLHAHRAGTAATTARQHVRHVQHRRGWDMAARCFLPACMLFQYSEWWLAPPAAQGLPPPIQDASCAHSINKEPPAEHTTNNTVAIKHTVGEEAAALRSLARGGRHTCARARARATARLFGRRIRGRGGTCARPWPPATHSREGHNTHDNNTRRAAAQAQGPRVCNAGRACTLSGAWPPAGAR